MFPNWKRSSMADIILYTATSLDGFIASEDGSVDWLFHDQDYGYSEFYESIGTTIMGYNTYAQILTFGPFPYPDKQNVVLTTQDRTPDPNVTFIRNDIRVTIQELRENSDLDIWLVGGGNVNSFFLASEWIDRLDVFIHPIVLGSGIPLFTKQAPRPSLHQNMEKTFSSGVIHKSFTIEY